MGWALRKGEKVDGQQERKDPPTFQEDVCCTVECREEGVQGPEEGDHMSSHCWLSWNAVSSQQLMLTNLGSH